MRVQLTDKQLDQLRERILKNSEPTEDGCRLWMGSIKLNRCGTPYGRISFRISGEKNPRSWSAHVVACMVKNGGHKAIGKVRAHTCHRTYCVELDHIIETTQKKNLEMSSAAGRLKRKPS